METKCFLHQSQYGRLNEGNMELANIAKIDYKMLAFEQFNFFLVALDSQKRCSFLAEHMQVEAAEKYILTTGDHHGDRELDENGKTFNRLGFRQVSVSGNQTTDLESFIERLCIAHQTNHINLLIDYSCMPKSWFAKIINGITAIDDQPKTISAFLSYTPKKNPQLQHVNGKVYSGPVMKEKDELRNSSKRPVALVAGLDHNYQSMLGLIKKVNPHEIVAFIPDFPDNKDYTDSVLKLNKPVLGKLKEQNIVRYNTKNPDEINAALTSQCMRLRLDSEVMIVPQGPKVFSMVAFLLSLRYPDIKLWEIVGKRRKKNQSEGEPAAHPVVVKADFCEDLDY